MFTALFTRQIEPYFYGYVVPLFFLYSANSNVDVSQGVRFDWHGYSHELRDLLHAALEKSDIAELAAFVNEAPNRFMDPHGGEPLNENWIELLSNVDDVHELGDYALTRFYNPADDRGLGNDWLLIEDSLSPSQRRALLGSPIGPATNQFDPGRMGSYVKCPKEVTASAAELRVCRDSRVVNFVQFLDDCVVSQSGVYVTF